MRRSEDLNSVISEIREIVLSRLDMSRDIPEEDIRKEIRREILRISRNTNFSVDERLSIERGVFNSLRKTGFAAGSS